MNGEQALRHDSQATLARLEVTARKRDIPDGPIDVLQARLASAWEKIFASREDVKRYAALRGIPPTPTIDVRLRQAMGIIDEVLHDLDRSSALGNK